MCKLAFVFIIIITIIIIIVIVFVITVFIVFITRRVTQQGDVNERGNANTCQIILP